MLETSELVWRPLEPGSRSGQVCVRYSYAETDAPIRHTLFWHVTPVGHDADAFLVFPEIADGKAVELRQLDTALWELYRGYGNHISIRLPGGGSQKAIACETDTIAVPKVRKGLDVRFTKGHWQKYLKLKGWIAA